MAQSIRASWFGRDVIVLMSNGKSIAGSISEATDTYIVLEDAGGNETQVMVHAIIAIKLAQNQANQPGAGNV